MAVKAPRKSSESRAAQKGKSVLIGLALLAASALLFARLGNYALWDDEANTALEAKAVMETGDTSILIDHGNIVAYRNGLLLRGLYERTEPPLAAYLTAGSFSLFGLSAFSARLPFALLGLGAVALLLLWVRREKWPVLVVFAAGLAGNVSLILFFRQCRYYGPAIFFSVAIVFVYWRWKPSPRNLLILAALSVLLFVGNYMDYLALYLCLGVDWLIWRRREWQPGRLGWVCLFGPQVILNCALSLVWNPLSTAFGGYGALNTFGDRVTLFFWYWRDMDQCEFFSIPVILLALVVGIVQRRIWLVRGCVAIAVYIAVITLISPQPVRITSVADVRYASLMIPLAVALEAGALCALFERRTILLLGAALLVFGTNLLNGGPFLDSGFRSTILSYAGELLHPPPEPYTPTAQWINDHVPEGESIWVLPDYATYPLMFHAPRALYAWQLDWPPRPDFARLPPIHFRGREAPDYLIAFGPGLNEMAQAMQSWNRPDVRYEQVATIHVFWKDLYRPELFWRTFTPVTNFDPGTQAVYIFKRTQPPLSAH